MSRRDQIKMADDEVAEFLGEPRTMNLASHGPAGTIHLVAMWYSPEPDAIWFETFAKSQKVANLRRDDHLSGLVEAGDSYDQLRGVQLQGRAEVIDDADRVLEVATSIVRRYHPDVAESDIGVVAEMMARKRVAIRFVADNTVTWDHRKLEGGY